MSPRRASYPEDIVCAHWLGTLHANVGLADFIWNSATGQPRRWPPDLPSQLLYDKFVREHVLAAFADDATEASIDKFGILLITVQDFKDIDNDFARADFMLPPPEVA